MVRKVWFLGKRSIWRCPGGVYSSGDYQAVDFLTPHLNFFLAFIGIDDVKIIRAEGFAVSGLKETALDVAIEGIKL
jgi:FMN-dependent NADH-azoreductase